jgi:hypothetical protein
MFFVILYYIVIAAIFFAGLFIILGSIKKVSFLIDVDDYYNNMYPYTVLKKIGPNAIRIFHLIIGLVFCVMAIVIFVND